MSYINKTVVDSQIMILKKNKVNDTDGCKNSKFYTTRVRKMFKFTSTVINLRKM